VAVGTTSMRTLESVYWYGASLITGNLSDTLYVSQWQPYEQQLLLPTAAESIEAVINKLESTKQTTIQGSTQIIIAPGYQFKIVDALITNFHQPENTLILLIAAFVNEDWRKIYDYALQHQFRFLSYGDSSLLWRKN
jgi:S-adenosylmethionine:tRNA ribosyltransferase-isomerase